MTITCEYCHYTAEIPSNMTPNTYARWHNWTRPVKDAGAQGITSCCSVCHA